MLSIMKNAAIRIFALSLFHSRILTLIRVFFNNFHLKRSEYCKISIPYVKKRKSKNFQILTYHRVNDDNDPFFSGMRVSIFEKHMEYLSYHFNILPLEEIIKYMRDNDIPENTIAITFDDGYRDVYLNAYPILKKFSIPATIFLPTSCIDTGEILWHDRVFSAFRETQQPLLMEYGIDTKTYSLGTVEEKLRAQHDILRFLRSLDSHERSAWIDCLIAKLFPQGRKKFFEMMLSWDDIKVMHAHGILFGSHTVTHPIISKISLDQAVWEIYESKKVIESHLGSPVRTFAYPNGKEEDFNHTTKELLQEAGYVCALTTILGTNAYGQDLFALRRGQPWETDLPLFAAKLNWYKFCS